MPAFDPLILNTERLILRFLDEGDAAALYAIHSEPQAMRYWSCAPWTAIGQAQDMIAATRAGYRDGSILRFGLEAKATGELIGTATLYAFDRPNRRCDIGYILAPRHWGHGYMPEALTALIEHGFGALNLHRIEADLHPSNDASASILRRLHFRLEGLLRERWFVNGELSDSAMYGLLRQDWRAARG